MLDCLQQEMRNQDVTADILKDHLDAFSLSFDGNTHTLNKYRRLISSFIAWGDGMVVNQLMIQTYRNYLVNRKLLPNTVALHLAALKRFFCFLVEIQVLNSNPAMEIRRPKIPRSLQRDALNEDEARLLLESIDKGTLESARDYAIVNLMLRTGLREEEISKAMISDIAECQVKMILNVHGKGREAKDSFVILTDKAFKPLLEYLSIRGCLSCDAPLFVSVGNRSKGAISTRAIRKIISRYLKRAGLKRARLTPHSLRHTAITLALQAEKGKNLLQVQQMARHADVSTTLRYFHEFRRFQYSAEESIDL